jgi:LysM repeat protein
VTATTIVWPIFDGEQQYTIEAGDSLSAVADRFQVSVGILVNYNDWSEGSNHRLLPGETILIPPGAIIPNP